MTKARFKVGDNVRLVRAICSAKRGSNDISPEDLLNYESLIGEVFELKYAPTLKDNDEIPVYESENHCFYEQEIDWA